MSGRSPKHYEGRIAQGVAAKPGHRQRPIPERRSPEMKRDVEIRESPLDELKRLNEELIQQLKEYYKSPADQEYLQIAEKQRRRRRNV